MRESIQYTQQEIDSAINTLNNSLEIHLRDRKELNAQIGQVKKNIKFYEDLDCSQIKMF